MKKTFRGYCLFIITVMMVSPAVTVAQNHDAVLRDIIEAIRVGWIEADGTPFREHFLDFEGARYFEGGGQNVGLTDLIDLELSCRYPVKGYTLSWIDEFR